MALVLTRRENEKVLLFVGDVKIEIASEVSGYNQVRLAIDAPKNVTILREEVYLRDQEKTNHGK